MQGLPGLSHTGPGSPPNNSHLPETKCLKMLQTTDGKRLVILYPPALRYIFHSSAVEHPPETVSVNRGQSSHSH